LGDADRSREFRLVDASVDHGFAKAVCGCTHMPRDTTSRIDRSLSLLLRAYEFTRSQWSWPILFRPMKLFETPCALPAAKLHLRG
jgi:hypothetical protein